MRHVWLCEGCQGTHTTRCSIFACPGCNGEVCDSCFDRYMHCKACSANKTDEELAVAAGMDV